MGIYCEGLWSLVGVRPHALQVVYELILFSFGLGPVFPLATKQAKKAIQQLSNVRGIRGTLNHFSNFASSLLGVELGTDVSQVPTNLRLSLSQARLEQSRLRDLARLLRATGCGRKDIEARNWDGAGVVFELVPFHLA